MFDGLKRKIVFGKVAGALQGLLDRLRGKPQTGDGKVLGWSMPQWKVWLEGMLFTAAFAAGGSMLAYLDSYRQCLAAGTATCSWDWHEFAVAALTAAVAGFTGWLRKSPSDPRRTQ